MNFSRINQVFQRAFPGCPEVDINTDKNNLENWDSVGNLVLILELEKEYQVRFQLEHIEEMRSVRSIVQVLEALKVAT